jgi:exodeoxyribonuclease V beta subunit
MISELRNIKNINVIIKEIQHENNPTAYTGPAPDNKKSVNLTFREMDFQVSTGYKIFSYSSLLKKSSKEEKDRDYFVYTKSEDNQITDRSTNIHNFPKGAETGNFFHEIFEEADYRDEGSVRIKTLAKIQKYDLDENWLQAAIDAVQNILNTEIKSSAVPFKLNQIAFSSRLNELEFYFPINKFNFEKFMKILNKHEDTFNSDEVPEINQSEGFIKGFIDLLIEINGKYYIFDWKTNYLGDSSADYNPDSLNAAMKDDNYFLQAIIYTLAVHRYLKSRIRDYQYSDHFAGAYYVFIRGYKGGFGSSFFHFKPDEKTINALDAYIDGGV